MTLRGTLRRPRRGHHRRRLGPRPRDRARASSPRAARSRCGTSMPTALDDAAQRRRRAPMRSRSTSPTARRSRAPPSESARGARPDRHAGELGRASPAPPRRCRNFRSTAGSASSTSTSTACSTAAARWCRYMLANGYGRIVNVASVAGKEGNPNASAYSASKAGVIGFTKSLGKELATQRRASSTRSRRRPSRARSSTSCRRARSTTCCSKIPMGRLGEVRRERGDGLLHGLARSAASPPPRPSTRRAGARRTEQVDRKRPATGRGGRGVRSAVRRRPCASVGPRPHPLSVADAAVRRRRPQRQRRADRADLSARRLPGRGRGLERRRHGPCRCRRRRRRRRSTRPTGCRSMADERGMPSGIVAFAALDDPEVETAARRACRAAERPRHPPHRQLARRSAAHLHAARRDAATRPGSAASACSAKYGLSLRSPGLSGPVRRARRG